MAGRRTPKEPFQGTTQSDETGTMYELEHEGTKGRIRFNNDGQVYFFVERGPMAITFFKWGNRWTTLHVKPTQ
jgi:hypothetical protein